MTNIYEEYALIEANIKALETKKEQLRPLILQQIIEQGKDTLETPVGRFTVNKLKKWSYPERVLALGEKFKAEKALAESTREATYTETESLRFTHVNL